MEVELIVNGHLLSDSCVAIPFEMLEYRGKMPLPHVFGN